MVPARVGAGAGREDRITINRRLRMKDGKHWTIRRATPSPPDDAVAGLGPLDPQIGLLRVDAMDGKPLALVYNFAGHAYGGAAGGGITADFPGFASRVVERAWPGAVALFLQGAAGDVTPIRYKDFDAPPPTELLGTRLGFSALEAAQRISTQSQAAVRIVRDTVELPRRTDAEQRIQALQAEQEKILGFFTGVGCGAHGAGTSLNFKSFLPLYMKQAIDPEHPAYAAYLYEQEERTGQNGLRQLDKENKQRIAMYRQCIEKMDRLIVVRTSLQFLQETLQTSSASGPIRVEIQALRVGDFVLVTFPGEPFAEVGLRIKKRSPFPNTFVAGYTNGRIGYAPTADAYDKDAYEDALTPLAPAVAGDLRRQGPGNDPPARSEFPLMVTRRRHFRAPQHFLNFFPLPQGQGSLRPIRRPRDSTGAVTGSAGSRRVSKCGGGGSGARCWAGFSVKAAQCRNSSIVSSIPVARHHSSSLRTRVSPSAMLCSTLPKSTRPESTKPRR